MKHYGSRILLILLLSLLLTGCIQSPTPTEPPAKNTCTVAYFVNGESYREQTVEEGQCPTAVSTAIQGITVLGWQDSQGNLVDPAQVAVTADVRYDLVFYPTLGRHVPYLFTNEYDQLRPDDILTEAELKQALEALAAGGAKAYFPELPDTDNPVDGQFVRKILMNFFPKAEVDAVMDDGTVIDRAYFAAAMNSLLGRDTQAAVTVADGTVLPIDVTRDRANAAQLLEAAVPHTESAEGKAWADMELPTTLEPGFVNLEGWLYYVTEDGYFLKDAKVGDLYFGSDGRYTTGDKELDGIVAEILKKMMAENPDKEGLSLLRLIHEYCRDSFKYLRRYDNHKEVGQTGWAAADAKEMFTTGRGNCYNYAAAFWALSRGIGYETYAISGTVLKDEQPHGWCLINIDGGDYFFDCEWEMAYRVQHNPPRYDMDMFMISTDPDTWKVNWRYQWTTY